MPVHKRKTWIMRHNAEQQKENEAYEAKMNGNSKSVDGNAINSYAEIEQNKLK